MRKKVVLLSLALSFLACKNEFATEQEVIADESSFASFGDAISADDFLSSDELLAMYQSLQPGDTVQIKFTSEIMDVCQKKGCWMNMTLPNDNKAFVRFKDYGFFMPLNAAGSEAVVEGKAFIDLITVDELKHFAKDAGKSQEEIDLIVEPKVTYAFTANGVLIKE